MIERLDHLNIRTENLSDLIAWYGEVLGLTPGPRPDFGSHGAWLYLGELPVVHLVETATAPGCDPDDLRLEHGAFRATDLPAFLALLRGRGDRFDLVRIPGMPIIQVNVWDPDGNHLHVDFAAAEAEGLDLPV